MSTLNAEKFNLLLNATILCTQVSPELALRGRIRLAWEGLPGEHQKSISGHALNLNMLDDSQKCREHEHALLGAD